MAKFAKGDGRPRQPKGSQNKATSAAREAISLFVDNNAHRLQKWLDEIAQKDPEKAFNMFQSVIEYHIPKLSRQDLNANTTGTLTIEVVRFGTDKNPGKQLES